MPFKAVAVEGPDDSGKSTIARKLCEITGALYWKYPYEDEFAGRECRRQLNEGIVDPAGFQALQTLNRYLTLPNLYEAGDAHGLVILDRWTLSSLVYGSTDGLPITWLNRLVRMLPSPDLYIRIVGKTYGQKIDSYTPKQAEIINKYDRLSALIDTPMIVIDNDRPIDEVVSACLDVLRCLGYLDFDDRVDYTNTGLIAGRTAFEHWADTYGVRTVRR